MSLTERENPLLRVGFHVQGTDGHKGRIILGLELNAAQVNERHGKLQPSRQPWQGALELRSEGVGVIAPASSWPLPGGRAHTSTLTPQPQCHRGQERKANTSAD